MFQQIQKIPAGAVIHSVASYDNTVNNLHNPYDPPITVYYGLTTAAEMLMTYFIYATYQPGDENIILDTTLLTSIADNLFQNKQESVQVYPNPTNDYLYVDAALTEYSRAELKLINTFGQVLERRSLSGNLIHEEIKMNLFPTGIYFVELRTEKYIHTKKILINVK
jgi:hypothetical protein